MMYVQLIAKLLKVDMETSSKIYEEMGKGWFDFSESSDRQIKKRSPPLQENVGDDVMEDEKKKVFVVRLFIRYEGQYFVGVFDDMEVCRFHVHELESTLSEKERVTHKFLINEVEMNTGEIRWF